MEKGNLQHNGGKVIPCVESYNEIFFNRMCKLLFQTPFHLTVHIKEAGDVEN